MQVVQLNVGGKHFSTTSATIRSMNISESFIDRDPTFFHYILNYLRNGCVVLPNETDELEQLSVEAEYYGVDELVKEIEALIKNKTILKEIIIMRKQRDSTIVNVEGPIQVFDLLSKNAQNLGIGAFLFSKCVNSRKYVEWKLCAKDTAKAKDLPKQMIMFLSQSNCTLKSVSSSETSEIFVLEYAVKEILC